MSGTVDVVVSIDRAPIEAAIAELRRLQRAVAEAGNIDDHDVRVDRAHAHYLAKRAIDAAVRSRR